MILKEIVKELENSEKPVPKILWQGEKSHILSIGLRKGMLLPKHNSKIPARIVVIKGEVVYNNDNGGIPLSLYDEHEIPVEEYHWIEALDDSMMLVIKGS